MAACQQVPEVAPGVRCPTGEARMTRSALDPALLQSMVSNWLKRQRQPLFRLDISSKCARSSMGACALHSAALRVARLWQNHYFLVNMKQSMPASVL